MGKIKQIGNTIYCIAHKESGEFCMFRSKAAWVSYNNAKRAYNFHSPYGPDLESEDCPYEIIEINN